MNCVKRFRILFLVFVAFVLFSSCKAELNHNKAPHDVDFTKEQKIQLVTGGDIYNVTVIYDENGKLYFKYLDETSEALKNTSIEIIAGSCTLKNDGIEYTTTLDSFPDEFAPKILYMFFYTTDFEETEFLYDSEERVYTTEKEVFGKSVIFNVQFSLDETTQNYIIEIK